MYSYCNAIVHGNTTSSKAGGVSIMFYFREISVFGFLAFVGHMLGLGGGGVRS